MLKKYLMAGVLTATLLAVLAMPAQAVTLKIATLLPDGSELLRAFKAADAEIRQATQGRVELKMYPGGVMGNDATVLKKMSIGQIHGSTFTAGGASNIYRDFQIMSLPMLFKSYDEVDVVQPKINPIIVRNLDAQGFVTVSVMDVGFAYLMSSAKLTTLDDLRGRKTWIPAGDPISKAVFDALGIPPTPLALQDVLTALQSGLIDTYVNSPVGAVGLQWFSRVKYLLDAPVVYTYATCVFSKKAFDQIAASDRETVKAILKKNLDPISAYNRKANGDAMNTLRKAGIQFIPSSDENYKKMNVIADKARQSLLANKVISPELLQQIDGLLAEHRAKKK